MPPLYGSKRCCNVSYAICRASVRQSQSVCSFSFYGREKPSISTVSLHCECDFVTGLFADFCCCCRLLLICRRHDDISRVDSSSRLIDGCRYVQAIKQRCADLKKCRSLWGRNFCSGLFTPPTRSTQNCLASSAVVFTLHSANATRQDRFVVSMSAVWTNHNGSVGKITYWSPHLPRFINLYLPRITNEHCGVLRICISSRWGVLWLWRRL